MAKDTNPNVPVCPKCDSQNTRFNRSEQKSVCNRCGYMGPREEFVKGE